MAKRYNQRYSKNNNLLTFMIVIIIAVVLGVGVMLIGYVSRNDEGKWFSNSDLASWHWSDNKKDEDNGNKDENKDENNGNVIITGGNSDSGVSVYSAVLPRSAYEANGISENADTAIKLTATIKPDYAYNKKVAWSVKWQNESAEWAQGKTVTDYVSVDSVGDLEANAICKQAFGEPVEITCTVEGTEIKSICQADYVKKVTDVNVVSGLTEQEDGTYLWVWNNYEVGENIYGESPAPSLTFDTVSDSVGTKEADSTKQSVKIEFSSELITAYAPTKTSETYSGLTIDGKELFYTDDSGEGFFYLDMVEWYDYEDIEIRAGYATFLTKCLSAGVDFNVTVTAGSFTKTFNVNVVVSAESVDIPSDIEF
ncbi:MAG: hypothetical protein ACI4MQ_05520 [Candidatus Coproplasma sp.]